MCLSILTGIIHWPQVLLFVGLVAFFFLGLGIPKTIKENLTGKKEYKNAKDDSESIKN